MRQVGILAAAGLHALDHHVDRLADDHRRARRIADVVDAAAPGRVDPAEVDTNIVVIADDGAAAVVAACKEQGVLVSLLDQRHLRLVTHLDVGDDDVERAAQVLAAALSGSGTARVVGDRPRRGRCVHSSRVRLRSTMRAGSAHPVLRTQVPDPQTVVRLGPRPPLRPVEEPRCASGRGRRYRFAEPDSGPRVDQPYLAVAVRAAMRLPRPANANCSTCPGSPRRWAARFQRPGVVEADPAVAASCREEVVGGHGRQGDAGHRGQQAVAVRAGRQVVGREFAAVHHRHESTVGGVGAVTTRCQAATRDERPVNRFHSRPRVAASVQPAEQQDVPVGDPLPVGRVPPESALDLVHRPSRPQVEHPALPGRVPHHESMRISGPGHSHVVAAVPDHPPGRRRDDCGREPRSAVQGPDLRPGRQEQVPAAL